MTYLIIAASSDIGREFIKYLDSRAEKNTIVFAHYNSSKDKLLELEKSLENIKLHLISADLSDENGATSVIMQIEEKKAKENLGEIDKILYLPAYPFNYMRLKELDMTIIKKEMQISVYSFLEICKSLIPKMKKQKNSRILAIVTSYVADKLPPKFMTDYIVSKYALLGGVKALASEHGGKNLMINAISPGMVETAFLKNIDPKIIEINREASDGLLQAYQLSPKIYELLDESCQLNGENIIVL